MSSRQAPWTVQKRKESSAHHLAWHVYFTKHTKALSYSGYRFRSRLIYILIHVRSLMTPCAYHITQQHDKGQMLEPWSGKGFQCKAAYMGLVEKNSRKLPIQCLLGLRGVLGAAMGAASTMMTSGTGSGTASVCVSASAAGQSFVGRLLWQRCKGFGVV